MGAGPREDFSGFGGDGVVDRHRIALHPYLALQEPRRTRKVAREGDQRRRMATTRRTRPLSADAERHLHAVTVLAASITRMADRSPVLESRGRASSDSTSGARSRAGPAAGK